MIKIYNSLTRKNEKLEITQPIKIYMCGITVYDFCHIGHARLFIVFDSLIRYLKYLNLKIILIRNITDIDDKIIEKAINSKKSFKDITEKFKKAMQNDLKNLNIIEPTFEPKATNFINEMILLIEKIIKKNIAYTSKNNDICYEIKKFKKYGILSKRLINEDNASDFVLWKRDKISKKIRWNSPWGSGRPGWHTECAAMLTYYEKTVINIHGGGQDLIFPHHENEIAQNKVTLNKDLVNIWMHVGHLKIKDQKMSKTNKNYILIKDLLKRFNEETLRFFFLLTHYKSQIEFSEENIEKSNKALIKLYKYIKNLNTENLTVVDEFKILFLKSLENDFNTSKAISILFDITRKIKNISIENSQNLIHTIKYLGNILGIFKYNPNKFLNNNENKKLNNKINKLILKRNIARNNKNWELADKIREKLKKLGLLIQDEKIL